MVAGLAAQSLDRVDTKVALAQIVKRVDPIVPPVAQSLRVGGTVIADVTISATGRVTAVNILAGPDLLHEATRTALRQWTFKPFVVRGQARSVITILEVKFPDPAKEEQDGNDEALRDATHECERQMEIDVAAAVPQCRKAMLATEKVRVAVSAQTIGYEYERAWRAYLNALIKAGHEQADIDTLKRAIETRAKLGRPGDHTSADAWATLAIMQGRARANADADASFAKSESIYSALMDTSPGSIDVFAPGLKGILTVHAAFRRSTGDAVGADALMSKAATLPVVSPTVSTATAPKVPARVTRRMGEIRVVEQEPAQLSGEDVRRIQVLMPGRAIAWMEITHVDNEKIPILMMADVCLKTVTGTSGLRRGHCQLLQKSKPDGRGQAGGWRKTPSGYDYVVFGDATDEQPTRVTTSPNDEPLSDERILAAQRLIARRAAAAPTDRLKSDIQPWRISSISPYQGRDFVFILGSGDGRSQSIVLRPVGDAWDVVDIR
jgi:TonB family protein